MEDYLRLAEAAAKSKERLQKLEAEFESLKVEIEKEKETYVRCLRDLEQNVKNQLMAATHLQNVKLDEKLDTEKRESAPSSGTTSTSTKDAKAVTELSNNSSKLGKTSPVENSSKRQRPEQPSPSNVVVIDETSQSSVKDSVVETTKKANDDNTLDVREKSNDAESKYSASGERKASSKPSKEEDDSSSINVGMEGKDIAKSLLMLHHDKHNAEMSRSAANVPPPPPSIYSRMDDAKSANSDGAHGSAEAFKNRKKDRRFSAVQLDVLRFIEERLPIVQAIFLDQKKRETDILPCPQAPQGNYYVRNEDKEKYKLPAGIQGTQPRFGKQNFNVLLHNVMLSGKKLRLDSNYVNFEDPRDCGEVIEKLYKAFNSFLQEEKSGARPHPQRFRQSTAASASSSSNAFLDAKE